jgi:class I fructose-bisphosphate aldolase
LAGTGKLVILPVDQGFEHGPARSFAPNPPAYNPLYHFQLAIEAGCNAYAAPLGLLEAGARDFAGEIPLILKTNDNDVLRDEKDPNQALTPSVQDALRLGCCAVGFTIYPGSASISNLGPDGEVISTPFLRYQTWRFRCLLLGANERAGPCSKP